jgi:hypothetical protein
MTSEERIEKALDLISGYLKRIKKEMDSIEPTPVNWKAPRDLTGAEVAARNRLLARRTELEALQKALKNGEE